MYVLYVDESGDHNLNSIQPAYPIFVLAGVAIEKDYHDHAFSEYLAGLKLALFGTDRIVIHTTDFTRCQNGFERMIEVDFRNQFFADINAWIAHEAYTGIACIIEKTRHLERYGTAANDPYYFSLEVLAERFWFFLRDRDSHGIIITESRDSYLDRQLGIAWAKIQKNGTAYVSANTLAKRVRGLFPRRKTDNIPGLQLADVIATPIGRNSLGRQFLVKYQIIETKLRRGPGGVVNGFGLVKLPK